MAKKLSLFLTAAAVIAFAVPAIAQAAPELTIGGAKATQGQTVTVTSENTTVQSSLTTFTCTHVAVHGVVQGNTGTTVEVQDDQNTGNTKGTHCTGGGKEIPVENLTLTRLHTSTVGSVNFVGSFTATIGSVDCSFSTAGSTGTYVPTATPLEIKFTNANFVGSPAPCEPGTLNGSFKLFSAGGAVVLH